MRSSPHLPLPQAAMATLHPLAVGAERNNMGTDPKALYFSPGPTMHFRRATGPSHHAILRFCCAFALKSSFYDAYHSPRLAQ